MVVEAELERRQLLRATPVFEGFSDGDLVGVAGLLEPVTFQPGEVIVREGDLADRCYVIAEGTANVNQLDLIGEPVTLAVLGAGDSFGERGLLDGTQRRSATVVAATQLEAFALPGPATRAVGERLRLALQRRLDALAIDTALKRASPFASLPHAALRQLASELQSMWVRKGDVVIQEGEVGDRMYLIRSGSVEVLKRKRRVAVLRAGDSFGEIAVLTSSRRTATVRALEDTELLVLSGEAFRGIAREYSAVASHFRELVGARFHGAPNQPLLLPDPLTTMMPLVGVRRRKRYWLVLGLGVLAFVMLTVAAQVSGSRAAMYAVTVVGALVGPVVFVQYLAESNLLSERPVELLLAAILGAALGLPPAFWLQHESGILPTSFGTAMLVAAIEEPAKLLGVVWLLHSPGLRFRMDGVIFGAAAGMGFAALETGMYALARVETIGALIGVLWLRALLSPFTHGTWTAITCATLWRERASGARHGAPRIVAALGAAILLHGLFDWPGFPMPFNFVWLVLVGVVSVVLLRAIRQQAGREEARAVIALAPETAYGASRKASVRCMGCGRRAPGGAHYCPRCGLALRRAERAS